jgi:hypothetical protein
MDGSCVSDSWDYRRSEKLIRQLEQMYQLESPVCQNPDRRSPSTGERRLMRRTGETSIREKLQDAIDTACQTVRTLPELISHLKERGIEASVKFTRTGQVQGICYQLNDITFSGTQLGRAYTFPGLQKHRNIDYHPSRDNSALQKLCLQKLSQKPDPSQSVNADKNSLVKPNPKNQGISLE